MNLEEITLRILNGGEVSRQEAVQLAAEAPLDALCDAADRITRSFMGNSVGSCSIVNARSGLCGEDCKWCAQSRHYSTGCAVYPMVEREKAMEAARHNSREGIRRLSLVTSGRRVGDRELDQYCGLYRQMAAETGLGLCASMGLLDKEQMLRLKEAGVTRYHCNMETAEAYFPHLCTTHSPADKRATIRAAREAGLEVCSGGIIGMGETMEQRVDFAFELKELGVVSVPVNILIPIPGTPLENMEPISEEEILRTLAMMRFVLPRTAIRFAGGRGRLGRDMMLRALRGGVNGVLMGDMLTTVSHQIADDRRLFAEAGLDFGCDGDCEKRKATTSTTTDKI